jgi:Mn2+/Fe2+ NRAMP family transporter
MVTTLEPIAGKFAVLVFLIGTIGAGLSSIFPVMIVAPLLIADYRDGELETKTPLFRILAGGACLFSLIVPLFGANPIAAQIATQVANVFVLPLVVLGMLVLINRSDLMGNHKAGILLNIGLIAVFFFSLFMSYIGFQGLGQFFRSGGV